MGAIADWLRARPVDRRALPDWVMLLEVARELGCRPWELLERPQFWTTMGATMLTARSEARRTEEKASNAGTQLSMMAAKHGARSVTGIEELRAMGVVSDGN